MLTLCPQSIRTPRASAGLLILLLVLFSSRNSAGEDSELTTVNQVRNLSPQQASAERAVRLRGVVTAISGWKSSFFFQDSSAGISIDRLDTSPDVQPGQLVEIVGLTGPGMFAPIIKAKSVRLVGTGKMPRAIAGTSFNLSGGTLDGQWTKVQGLVRTAGVKQIWGHDVLVLELDVGEGTLVNARVRNFDSKSWQRLPAAIVSLRGVCGTVFNDRKQYVASRVFIPSLDYVKVLHPGPVDLFDRSFQSLSNIARFSSGQNASIPIKVRATVSYWQGEGRVYVQDGSQGISAKTNQQDSFAPGSIVDIVGYVREGDYSPSLENATFRLASAGPILPLVPVNTIPARMVEEKEGFAASPFDSLLVRLSGTLKQVVPGVDEQILFLQKGQNVFTARLSNSSTTSDLPPIGSEIQITGVCVTRVNGAHEPVGFQVLLRSTADVVILRKAPWWNAKHAKVVVAAMGITIAAMVVLFPFFRRVAILKESNRAKSDFLANMSHEVRTPVNAIMGMAYLAMRANPSAQQRSYLTKINTAANNLLGIINDILNFSKIEAGKLALESIAFPLEGVLNDLRDIVSDKAKGKGLPLVFSLESNLPEYLVGDPLRLGQILINLVSNAIKFTQNGKIFLHVARATRSTAKRPELERLQFSVVDTGIGMTEAQIADLFQSFHQADSSFTRQYGGTGLGLAISKQLVELMNGAIWVESKLGVGSTFHFTAEFGTANSALTDLVRSSIYAPEVSLGKMHVLVVDDDQDGRNHVVAIRPTPLAGRRVLLVEDNELNRDLAIELLGDLGLVVTVAVNGRVAVDLVDSQSFDLILMDIQMPLMDGLTATKLIRTDSRFDRIPIVAMTAHAMSGDRERSLKAGLNDHLTKPIDPAALTQTLMRWIPAAPAPISLKIAPAHTFDEGVPDLLPPFDIPRALARTNNKPRLLRKMLIGFHDQYACTVPELRRYLEEGSLEQAERLAHSLKSIAAMLEAKDLAAAAAEVEAALRNHQLQGLPRLVDALEERLAPAVDAAGKLDHRKSVA